eukprot:TRINITY_DN15673_c0_g1_i1.p3 TRINITY_DN15673_c0_g1~~TRINITY_DN15673_c0_g1_i1.p3  ORF type:complete len:142 (+),score=46.83 TRINITY_DN15673_c0_g1_i1:590-1015(+)
MFAVRGSVLGGYPPRKSNVPQWLADAFAQAGRDWGVISWGAFAEKYFAPDCVAYTRAPGQPIGGFLSGSAVGGLMHAYSQLPGCGAGHVDWAVLDYLIESPTKLHLVGHNNKGPATPPFYQLWEKGADGWKIIEVSTSIGA